MRVRGPGRTGASGAGKLSGARGLGGEGRGKEPGRPVGWAAWGDCQGPWVCGRVQSGARCGHPGAEGGRVAAGEGRDLHPEEARGVRDGSGGPVRAPWGRGRGTSRRGDRGAGTWCAGGPGRAEAEAAEDWRLTPSRPRRGPGCGCKEDLGLRGSSEGPGNEAPRSEWGSGRGRLQAGLEVPAVGAGGTRTSFVPESPLPGARGSTSWHVAVSPSREPQAVRMCGCSAERRPGEPIAGRGGEGTCGGSSCARTVLRKSCQPLSSPRPRPDREHDGKVPLQSPRVGALPCPRLRVPTWKPHRQLCKSGGGAVPQERGSGGGAGALARALHQSGGLGRERYVGTRLNGRDAAPRALRRGAVLRAHFRPCRLVQACCALQKARPSGNFLLHVPWSTDRVATRSSAHREPESFS